MLMSVGILFAIREAVTSARQDSGLSGWWQLNSPATVENIQQHAGLRPELFVF